MVVKFRNPESLGCASRWTIDEGCFDGDVKGFGEFFAFLEVQWNIPYCSF